MRCRASLVAAATGVCGPGQTVLLRRPVVQDRRWLQRAAVVVSLLAMVAAWGYASAPEPRVPLSSVQVQATLQPSRPALGTEGNRASDTPGSRSVSVGVDSLQSSAEGSSEHAARSAR
jgi:hypothetical protein